MKDTIIQTLLNGFIENMMSSKMEKCRFNVYKSYLTSNLMILGVKKNTIVFKVFFLRKKETKIGDLSYFLSLRNKLKQKVSLVVILNLF